jgi:hypothetical protein
METRTDRIAEYPLDCYDDLASKARAANIVMDTDGHVMFTLPKGSTGKAAQGVIAYLWPLDGMGDSGISRVTGTLTCAGASKIGLTILACEDDPFDATTIGDFDFATVCSVASTAADSGAFDTNSGYVLSGLLVTHLRFYCGLPDDTPETSQEDVIQIRDLRVYCAWSGPITPDQIIASIATNGPGLCGPSDTETLGDAVTHFMIDPFATRAQAIEQARALYSGIMDVGVWEDATIHVRARPTSPPDRSRWIALTLDDLLEPERDWGIMADTEAAVDAVCTSYAVVADAGGLPDGTPQSVYYPSNPSAADARVALLNLETATDAEALAAATQVYMYMSQLATGGVALDAGHLTARYGTAAVQTVDGALLPIDQIRSWDWIMCADAPDEDSRGPWMISRVERGGDGTTIEVGGDYWEHPGFDHPERKGKYIAGRWRRKRVKVWRTGKRPAGKGWHRKGKRWWKWGWKRKWVEGRYA